MSEPETIVAAAVQAVDGRVHSLPRPARHCAVILDARVNRDFRREDVQRQGFTTSAGRFLDRIEAERVARAAGQLLREPLGVMTSEDLW